ncbi:hypothetical protein GAN78_02110 [Bacteroides thetaiotaomicron]|uniref:gp53-like domain-containing protein n=1 Tax=Bacteroides thetaiotaomicron TaxID=818 RepID=UPI001306A76C|nr:hypothetical protein [Bacteroides thetaiotaomicron]KAB4517850.1 hypothetical protein GAN78_02110 [Bacteroides thetaiotaomicron]KAB4795755.1 hypothetical protein GAG82_00915 [Bacteroides thetaiotaomicron]KAB4860089.1 hypothetical protein GAG77_01060 [Bacteroides thetaiotaomicron]MCE8993783.1 hypothetical protein [Bacteroides thetaiotaomicron]
MNCFSRKLRIILVIIFLQSSLGTKADLVNSVNLGQNGYKKFEDGFLIQWGKGTNSSNGNMTVWFNIAFGDTNYSLVTTMETVSNEQAVYGAMPYAKYASYFSVRRRYATATDNGDTAKSFNWIAIGRWK